MFIHDRWGVEKYRNVLKKVSIMDRLLVFFKKKVLSLAYVRKL